MRASAHLLAFVGWLLGAAPAVLAQEAPKEPVPPVTEADRKAAFPEGIDGHGVHARRINYLVLFDQLEWYGGTSGGMNIDNKTWIGGDIDRVWIRADTNTDGGRVDHASVHALWGHSISRWWDVVGGIRQDLRPGDPQTMGAIGIQGLAPYWFDVQATAYIGGGGRTELRFEGDYDLLVTNRLIAQLVGEMAIAGKADPERRIGAGLSSIEAGVRVRYEFRREIAPYVGVTWNRKLYGTAEFARQDDEATGGARLTLGVRAWF